MNLMNLTNPDFLKRPEDIPLADLDCYRPPITAIISDWETKFENDAVEAVIRYGFDINKEELEKALKYDRGQYEKGYADARRNYERPAGKWKLDDTEQFCYCSNCEDTYYPRPLDPSWHYCPHCGATMNQEQEEYK